MSFGNIVQEMAAQNAAMNAAALATSMRVAAAPAALTLSPTIGAIIDRATPAPVPDTPELYQLSGAGAYDTGDYVAWALAPTEVVVGFRFLTGVGNTDSGLRRFDHMYVRDARWIADTSRDRTLVFPDNLGNWDGGTWYTWMAPNGHALTGFRWNGWRSIRNIYFQTRSISTGAASESVGYGSTQIGLGGMYVITATAPTGSFIADLTIWGNSSGGSDRGIKYIQNIGYKDMTIIAKMISDPTTRIGCLKATSDAALCAGFAGLGTQIANDALVSAWCPDHLDDPFCSCSLPMPADVLAIQGMEQIKAMPQCWNADCNRVGYKSSGRQAACPSITICTQNMILSSATDNVIKSNNFKQDCSNNTVKPVDPVVPAAPIVPLISAYSTEDMILILIFVLVIAIATAYGLGAFGDKISGGSSPYLNMNK